MTVHAHDLPIALRQALAIAILQKTNINDPAWDYKVELAASLIAGNNKRRHSSEENKNAHR